MIALTLLLGNDCVLELNSLKDEITGIYFNASAVTYALKDSTGLTIDAGGMVYVAGSDGVYRATLADTLSLAAGDDYTAVVDADSGPGLMYHSETAVIAKIRT